MTREAIFEASARYFLQPIAPFMDDESVTEIMVNGHEEVYIERNGRLQRTDARFESEDALLSAIHNVAQWVGREISEEHPVLDARLPDGSRVHAVIPPAARTGIYLTIRRFSRETLTIEKLIELGSLSEEVWEFLRLCVRLRKNVLISGGTGTGKTVLLGALARAIPEEERIVVIEDTSELRLVQPHTLYLEARHAELRLVQPHTLYLEARHAGRFAREGLDVRELFVNSLRMRPDRIIVGEVRGAALDALARLEILSLMSDVNIPVYVARTQVASAIHVVVQLARFSEDGSRKITRVSEVCGLGEDNRYQVADLYVCRLHGRTREGRLKARFERTGVRPTFARDPFDQGMEHLIQLTEGLWEQ